MNSRPFSGSPILACPYEACRPMIPRLHIDSLQPLWLLFRAKSHTMLRLILVLPSPDLSRLARATGRIQATFKPGLVGTATSSLAPVLSASPSSSSPRPKPPSPTLLFIRARQNDRISLAVDGHPYYRLCGPAGVSCLW
ncbi:hypothetical protein BO94DRAFT_98602 [Aspergillus sclerotioniger CBS 115572]|uniref:Uncharacterized protein n=1 Tax=Aspergillus sclerotioniger CBS 115572 TaxID=1450535 RepID=A0A317WNK9_9EURO|nr:hypothetical protein BO94DRAFT_98602 [Aspergillus sclerotioniger CBS 115572]PWY85840.1 hypothetical protein BO94DRAFT_98602 [Aspergillus sclerotioniger CBS 115572]